MKYEHFHQPPLMPTVKLQAAQAETLALGYAALKNAIELFQALNAEAIPQQVSREILPVIAELRNIQSRFDRRIGNNPVFATHLQQNDTLRLVELQRIFIGLPPDQQEALEEAFRIMQKGETIEISKI